MGASAPNYPAPTDPDKTASADFNAQKAAAGYNAQYYTPNLSGPAGSVTYDKVDLPDTTLLNGTVLPGGQGITGINQEFSPQFNSIFQRLTGAGSNLVDQLSTGGFNPNINNAALRQSYVNEGLADVRPEWDRQDNALQVQMAERGIPLGGRIYNDAYNQMHEQRNDYMQSLTNQAHGAASTDQANQFNQALTQHNAGFSDFGNFYNAVSGMMAGLAGNPQQMNTSQVAAPNVANIVGNYDQQNTALANAQTQAASQGMSAGLGMLGKLGGAAIMMSDERLKDDIEPVGMLDEGYGQEPLPIYEWSYTGDPERHIGPMAQDLAETNPELVHRHPSGFLMINATAPTRPSLAKLLREGF